MTIHSPNPNLGKYEILSEIGRGGFATVHLARDTKLDRHVALKIMAPTLLYDPNFITRFEQEARTAARLRHPHIITIFEMGEIEGRYYIAMDYIADGSLRDYLHQQGPLSWAEAEKLLRQILDALAFAHEQGVVHRDLKPANILLDKRNGSILTDFGFARLVGDSSLSLTTSGGIIGTPSYIPVEVWEGRRGDERADIYAVGCILYEMLTGQQLFEGDTPIAIMRQHDGGPVIHDWPADVPSAVQDIVLKATKKELTDRYQSIEDFVTLLDTVVHNSTSHRPYIPNPESDSNPVTSEEDATLHVDATIPNRIVGMILTIIYALLLLIFLLVFLTSFL